MEYALYFASAVAIIAILWYIKKNPGIFMRIIDGFFDILDVFG